MLRYTSLGVELLEPGEAGFVDEGQAEHASHRRHRAEADAVPISAGRE